MNWTKPGEKLNLWDQQIVYIGMTINRQKRRTNTWIADKGTLDLVKQFTPSHILTNIPWE